MEAPREVTDWPQMATSLMPVHMPSELFGYGLTPNDASLMPMEIFGEHHGHLAAWMPMEMLQRAPRLRTVPK